MAPLAPSPMSPDLSQIKAPVLKKKPILSQKNGTPILPGNAVSGDTMGLNTGINKASNFNYSQQQSQYQQMPKDMKLIAGTQAPTSLKAPEPTQPQQKKTFIPKSDLKTILDKFPTNEERKQAMQGLIQRGFTIEGVNDPQSLADFSQTPVKVSDGPIDNRPKMKNPLVGAITAPLQGIGGAIKGAFQGLKESVTTGADEYAQSVANEMQASDGSIGAEAKRLGMGGLDTLHYIAQIPGKTIGGAISGGIKGFYEGATTERGREIIGGKAKEGADKVIKAAAPVIEPITKAYEKLPEPVKKGAKLAARTAIDVADIAGAKALVAPVTQGVKGARGFIADEVVNTKLLAKDIASKAGNIKSKIPSIIPKGAGNNIAESLIASELKNPAMRKKYISKVGQTPEKTILEEGVKGSLAEQSDQIVQKSQQAQKTSREMAKKIPDKVSSEEGAWITDKIIEGVDLNIPGIKKRLEPIISMSERFKKGTATVEDLNEAKTMLGRYEAIYDDFGRVKKTGDQFEKEALNDMYQKMKGEIELYGSKYGIDFKALNQETMKWQGLRDLYASALARESGRDMISLSDYVLGGITMAGDPMLGVGLGIGKKVLQSPKISSRIANLLYSKIKKNGSSIGDTATIDRNVARGVMEQGSKQITPQLPYKGPMSTAISANPTGVKLPQVIKGGDEFIASPKGIAKKGDTIELGTAKQPGTSKIIEGVKKIQGETPVKTVPKSTQTSIEPKKTTIDQGAKKVVQRDASLTKKDNVDDIFAKLDSPEITIPYLKKQIPIEEAKLVEFKKGAKQDPGSKGWVTYSMVDKQEKLIRTMKSELDKLSPKSDTPIIPKKKK